MGCPKGQYYCNDEQMCKSIPAGHKVLKSGELVKEDLKKQINNELQNLTKSKTFNSFKKDALQIKGTLEKSANKFNQSDFKNQIKDIGTNFANTAIDQLTRAAKKKVNSFGESAYIEEIDGSKVALGLTAGVFGAGLELARRGKKFADKLKEKMDKRTKLKEETQGGINIETYTDGVQFNEIETVNIIEPPKMKSSAHLTFINDLTEETK